MKAQCVQCVECQRNYEPATSESELVCPACRGTPRRAKESSQAFFRGGLGLPSVIGLAIFGMLALWVILVWVLKSGESIFK